MELNPEDLLAQIERDYPDVVEACRLRLTVSRLSDDNDRLRSERDQLRRDLDDARPRPSFSGDLPIAGSMPGIGQP